MNSQRTAQHLEPLDPTAVRVRGEIGRRIDLTIDANLLALDIEKDFLQPIRDRNLCDGYFGLGKLIEATVRFAAYRGDARLRDFKTRLVDATLALQAEDGYIGALIPENRHWGVYDIHETAHVVLGLANDHCFHGDAGSLQSARKLADYILRCWEAEPQRFPGPDGTRARLYGVTTGLDAALLTLTEVSGEQKYADFLLHFPSYLLAEWSVNPQIGGREYMDDERHCYVFMALCCAQLQLQRLAPWPGYLQQTEKALHFLTHEDGLLVSGSCSLSEGWHNDQCGGGAVSESCATAYLIRLLHRMLQATGEVRWGDMLERAIYNALFAAQEPQGRSLRYFTPLEGERTLFERDTFCCPNNFRRIMAELPQMIYYRRGAGLLVNLYTTSEVRLTLEQGAALTIRQETEYPRTGDVLLHLDLTCPVHFPFALRLPRWCRGAEVTVNGKECPLTSQEGLLIIEREWHSGDRIELHFPLEWRWVAGRKLQGGRAALLRGPQLFCLNPAHQPALAGVDPREITLDPTTLQAPMRRDTVLPGALHGRVQGWVFSPSSSPPTRLEMELTEFPDPGGTATHLRILPEDAGMLVPDELMDSTDREILA